MARHVLVRRAIALYPLTLPQVRNYSSYTARVRIVLVISIADFLPFPAASLKIRSGPNTVNSPTPQAQTDAAQPLARRLGLFDATMLVMGGIVGTGHFHESLCGRPARAYACVGAGRVAGWRLHRALGWIHLGGTGGPHARGRRPVCLSARRLPSPGFISLWLGIAPGDPDRRHGRRNRHLRALFSGAHRVGTRPTGRLHWSP